MPLSHRHLHLAEHVLDRRESDARLRVTLECFCNSHGKKERRDKEWGVRSLVTGGVCQHNVGDDNGKREWKKASCQSGLDARARRGRVGAGASFISCPGWPGQTHRPLTNRTAWKCLQIRLAISHHCCCCCWCCWCYWNYCWCRWCSDLRCSRLTTLRLTTLRLMMLKPQSLAQLEGSEHSLFSVDKAIKHQTTSLLIISPLQHHSQAAL